MNDPRFITFKNATEEADIPNAINNPFHKEVPKLCEIASLELSIFLEENHQNWNHNFGIDTKDRSKVKGKMFGVLVCQNEEDQLGYLAAYSGKLQNEEAPEVFVPSVFDVKAHDQFLNKGMIALGEYSKEIKLLTAKDYHANKEEINALKEKRKEHSVQLQRKLFEHYAFSNQAGEKRTLLAIFSEYANRMPASGAGECAAPKLLQYAFEKNLKPLAIAEFWWGRPGFKSEKEHGKFYPSCEDKCRPILSFMLNLEGEI